MNLDELYEQIPAERHKDIRIAKGRVFVQDAGGNVAEYLVLDDEELWLIRCDREQKQDIKAIKAKLSIGEIAK